MQLKTKQLTQCAMFSALSVILSQISIPIGPVPINLVHISIFISANLLGAKYGAMSQVIFVLLGVMGVPVFSGLSGGIGVIIGPTGGFIIGYIGCAFVTGLVMNHCNFSLKVSIMAMYLGLIASYILGTFFLC